MSPKHLSVAGLVIGAAAILAGCATATPAEDTAGPDQAGGRLADPAAPAHGARGPAAGHRNPARSADDATAGQPAHEVIPYSAVVYDTDGSTWTYVNTAARTYEREPITVTDIDGDVALLSAGPAAGTPVVTVGAAELLGTEYNISGEE